MMTKFYTGAVCYIDLLGFSYLTNLLENNELYNDNKEKVSFEEKRIKDLTLNDLRHLHDYVKFGNDEICDISKTEITISDWAYKIVDTNLKKFHAIVKEQCVDYKDVNFSAISDSMFIAGENSDHVLFILANVFRECIKSGILLRAGLAYGSYYTVKTPVSNFNIYGTAATKAVDYEKKGKGCRIFTDADFAKTSTSFSEGYPNLFRPYKNFQNYSVLDCFEYLMIKGDYIFNPTDINFLPNSINSLPSKKALGLFLDNYRVECKLRYSPIFSWNLRNPQGTEHLGASIEYVCDLIDRISGMCKFSENAGLHEGLEDGLYLAKSQKRSEEIFENVVEIKESELIKCLRLENKVDKNSLI